jgi:hypothetical protein
LSSSRWRFFSSRSRFLRSRGSSAGVTTRGAVAGGGVPGGGTLGAGAGAPAGAVGAA